ncbi:hypothetical protein C9374_003031 [Naegleria lovaniensis]|uniref:Major facilitator superfamily (MFS) profile domain-containing protein n=1 Tax=Naegleria lovaniensis TaxID=51637 RepID=A0AA88GND9_NAELO|nr:uncharacterized protein C9374_003031 [Naegleria lovaniensis]KAG2385882.1 hypothetical protein C9374_003031 [Naegleria lovaniensis]
MMTSHTLEGNQERMGLLASMQDSLDDEARMEFRKEDVLSGVNHNYGSIQGDDETIPMTNSGKTIYISCDEAIEYMGVGKFQIILLFICGIAWMADASEIMILSFIMPAVSNAWNLSPVEEATIGGVVFGGMLIGALFWGFICDKFGRKLGIIAIFTFCSIFGVLSSFCPNFWTLVVARLLVGFGVGGSHAPFSLFTEFLPAKSRGFFLLVIEVFWTVGTMATSLLALLFLGYPEIFGEWGWRYLVGVSSVPNFIMLLAVPFLPESPRFCVIKGNIEKAERIFKRVAWWNRKAMFAASLQKPSDTENGKKKSTGSFLDLFSKKMWFSSVVLFTLWFIGALGYYGVVVITPIYFGGNSKDIKSGYISTIIVSAAELPGLLLSYSIINSFGRKKTTAIMFLACGLCLACLMIPIPKVYNWLPTIYAVGARMSIMGASCVLWVYTPEVFTTNIRSLGTGVASSSARVAAMITPYIATVLIRINSVIPIAIYSGSCLFAFVITHLLPYETAGKSLADGENEIDAVLIKTTRNESINGQTKKILNDDCKSCYEY